MKKSKVFKIISGGNHRKGTYPNMEEECELHLKDLPFIIPREAKKFQFVFAKKETEQSMKFNINRCVLEEGRQGEVYFILRDFNDHKYPCNETFCQCVWW